MLHAQLLFRVKDTRSEKASASKIPAFKESMNKDTWVVVTLIQIFIRGS